MERRCQGPLYHSQVQRLPLTPQNGAGLKRLDGPLPASLFKSLYFLKQSGFTIIELIVVLVLLGVLVAAVATRVPTGFLGSQGIGVQVAVDQVVADIQYAQALAMAAAAQRRISFAAGATAYQIQNESGVLIEQRNLPAGVSIAAVTNNPVIFNSLGEKMSGTSTVTIGGRSITIYGVTGKVL